MAAKPLRTKPKSASAERCLRALGATRDMATPDMETSNCACEGCIVAWRFTKRQPGGRGDYWGLSLSGNCWDQQHLWGPPPRGGARRRAWATVASARAWPAEEATPGAAL